MALRDRNKKGIDGLNKKKVIGVLALKAITISLLTTASLIALETPVTTGNSVNGRYWRNCSADQRRTYFHAFFDGMNVGQWLITKGTGRKAWFPGATFDEFSHFLDRIYEDPMNRSIPIKLVFYHLRESHLIAHVILSKQWTPDEKVVSSLRKQAIEMQEEYDRRMESVRKKLSPQ